MGLELKKILLVEDSPNDAELTLEALKLARLANEVIWLKDGQEALDFLYCHDAYAGRPRVNPVLILLDLKMPRIDGFQVLKQIKDDEKLRTIPVVILTSSREEVDLVRGYKNGVNAFVVKPVDFKEFIDSVSKLGAFWALLNEVPSLTI